MSLRGAAQTSSPTTSVETSTSKAATAPDSVMAVQKLFAKRRTGSVILAIPGGYLLGSGLVSTIRYGVDEQGPTTVVLGAILSGVAIAKGARFSDKREAAVISAYQGGQPLPRAIRRRLKNKHFRS